MAACSVTRHRDQPHGPDLRKVWVKELPSTTSLMQTPEIIAIGVSMTPIESWTGKGSCPENKQRHSLNLHGAQKTSLCCGPAAKCNHSYPSPKALGLTLNGCISFCLPGQETAGSGNTLTQDRFHHHYYGTEVLLIHEPHCLPAPPKTTCLASPTEGCPQPSLHSLAQRTVWCSFMCWHGNWVPCPLQGWTRKGVAW